MSDELYSEALRLIRKHMEPGDTLGKMFMRVAKELDGEDWQPIDTKPPFVPCEERGVYTDKNGDGLFFFKPTHWRPLREPDRHNS